MTDKAQNGLSMPLLLTLAEVVEGYSRIEDDSAVNVIGSEDHTLRRMLQALKNRRGRFTLFFVVCNEVLQRNQLVAEIKAALPEQHLVELSVTGEEENLLDRLLAAPGKPEPLFVYRFEELLPSAGDDAAKRRRETTLHELQMNRERYRQLERPLAIWLPEYAYSLLSQRAHDFWSWQSEAFFFTDVQSRKSGQSDNKANDPDEFHPGDDVELAISNNPRGAIDYYQQALVVVTSQTSDQHNKFTVLNNLGLAYDNLGMTNRAIECYVQALMVAREVGDRDGEASMLGNLGLAYADMGETLHAIEYYTQALVIDREIGDRRGEGANLGNLGVAYKDLGEMHRAIEFYEQALVTEREIGDYHGEATVLGNLGNAYAILGQPDRAIDLFEQQLVIARRISDLRGEGNALWNKSLSLDELGKREEAISCAEMAMVILKKLESPYAEQVSRQLEVWEKNSWRRFRAEWLQRLDDGEAEKNSWRRFRARWRRFFTKIWRA